MLLKRLVRLVDGWRIHGITQNVLDIGGYMNVKRNQIFVIKSCYHLLPLNFISRYSACAQSGVDIAGMD
jgi:hypothetical protein